MMPHSSQPANTHDQEVMLVVVSLSSKRGAICLICLRMYAFQFPVRVPLRCMMKR